MTQSRFFEPEPAANWPYNRIDLHTHTSRSDGVLTPAELYRAMAEWGLQVAGVADHDTVAGYRELAADIAAGRLSGGPQLIAAVEINSVADRALIDLGVELEEGELHMLGYGMRMDDPTFLGQMEAQKGARMARLMMIVEALRRLEVPIDEQIEPVLASDEAVGRPHIARAMVAAGHVQSVQEAFDKWIDRNGPAYVPRQGMKSRAAIDAIHAAGGIAVLAHYPAAPEQPALVKLLLDWGIEGLEVYYRRFRADTVTRMEALARSRELLATGGSDYHGDTMTYAEAQATTYVPRAAADELLARLAALPTGAPTAQSAAAARR
jgi:predicted metal-dependent phosphoesterase TrpH